MLQGYPGHPLPRKGDPIPTSFAEIQIKHIVQTMLIILFFNHLLNLRPLPPPNPETPCPKPAIR